MSQSQALNGTQQNANTERVLAALGIKKYDSNRVLTDVDMGDDDENRDDGPCPHCGY